MSSEIRGRLRSAAINLEADQDKRRETQEALSQIVSQRKIHAEVIKLAMACCVQAGEEEPGKTDWIQSNGVESADLPKGAVMEWRLHPKWDSGKALLLQGRVVGDDAGQKFDIAAIGIDALFEAGKESELDQGVVLVPEDSWGDHYHRAIDSDSEDFQLVQRAVNLIANQSGIETI